MSAVALAGVSAVAAAPSGRLSSARTHLQAVSADAGGNAWAVGFTDTGAPVSLHWDGRSLSPVPTPVAQGQLFGVSALSPSDAWAVGSFAPARAHMIKTLVLHWDGTRWALMNSPSPGPVANELDSVHAISDRDVWATGSYLGRSDHKHHRMVIRWDGARWSNVPLPPGGAGALAPAGFSFALFDPISSTSAFAIGDSFTRVGHGRIKSDRITHWNGHSWHNGPRLFGAALFGVSAVSGSDAWAVGYNCAKTRCPPFRTIVYHWDGRHWNGGLNHFIQSPTEDDSRLTSVTARSSSDVWATGTCQGRCRHGHSFAIRWNGSVWSRVASPGVAFSSPISPVTANDAWALGSGGVLLQWNGSSWIRH